MSQATCDRWEGMTPEQKAQEIAEKVLRWHLSSTALRDTGKASLNM
jgi:hypothetical protein